MRSLLPVHGSAPPLKRVLCFACLYLPFYIGGLIGGLLAPASVWANGAKTAPAALLQKPGEVRGLVHSTRYEQPARLGTTYYLLVLPDDRVAPAVRQPELEHGLQRQLHQMLQQQGYGRSTEHMLEADVVVVARLGVRPDRPNVDAILSAVANPALRRGLEPDAELRTGVRYVQLEAYDLPQYAEFLRQHENAAQDVSAQFQSWRTTVESRGVLADFTGVLPTLVQVAAQRLGSQMQRIERFNQPLWSHR